MKNLALKKTFTIFGKWFCEKSRSKVGFLFFSENGFVKNLTLKKAFFGKCFINLPKGISFSTSRDGKFDKVPFHNISYRQYTADFVPAKWTKNSKFQVVIIIVQVDKLIKDRGEYTMLMLMYYK
jgi:hypothetical protein